MKKSNISYESIIDFEKIRNAYRIIEKNSRHKDKIINYNMFRSANLISIYENLKNKNYRHGRYNLFLICDPKYRVIMSENLNDRIVNHVVSEEILKPVIEKKLVDCNCATRVGKGSSYAFNLCKKYMNTLKYKYDEFYILKFDIKKYFYNINHEILLNKLKRIYTDKDIMAILEEIIESTDYDYINDVIDSTSEAEIKKNIPPEKVEELRMIPKYTKNKGLAIGNVTSQIFAVFYLNDLDHFIKEKLQCKYYIRYMDDGIIMDKDKERLKEILKEITKKVGEEKLELNRKTNIYKASSGFTFIGYRFFVRNNRIIVRANKVVKKRIKRKIKYLQSHNPEKLERVKASYYGYLKGKSTNQLLHNFQINLK